MPYAPDSYPRQIPQFKVHGRGEVTVSAKGIITGDSSIPNDGADFGPDTMLGATETGQYGPPYSTTNGVWETFVYGFKNSLNVLCGEGTFNINSALPFTTNMGFSNYNGLSLFVRGSPRGTIFNFTFLATSGAIQINLDTLARQSIIYFENITFSGLSTSGAGNSPDGSVGIAVQSNTPSNQIFSMFYNCLFMQFSSLVLVYGSGGGCARLTLDTCSFTNSASTGFTTGVPTDSPNTDSELFIIRPKMWNIDDSPIAFDQAITGVRIISPIIDRTNSPRGSGAEFNNPTGLCKDFFIENFFSIDNGTYASGNGLNINSAGIENFVVRNTKCIVQGSSGYGINFYSGGTYSHCVIDNFDFSETTTPINTRSSYNGIVISNSKGYNPTPAITANPPVTATVYQNTNPYDIEIDLPVYATTSGTAGYLTIAKGSTSTPTAIGNQYVNGATSSTSTDIIKLRVPAGWYYSFTASGVTLVTASVFAD